MAPEVSISCSRAEMTGALVSQCDNAFSKAPCDLRPVLLKSLVKVTKRDSMSPFSWLSSLDLT